MKTLIQSIQEKLVITKDTKEKLYHYHPTEKYELKELIIKLINKRGDNADLNDIDTSKITDMSTLFYKSSFNGDISKWDVSSVKDMSHMFDESSFTGENGGISNWDVSSVINMDYMFTNSKFKGNISNWNVRNVKSKNDIFYKCPLQNNPPI